jgi:molecular chaperone GrpE
MAKKKEHHEEDSVQGNGLPDHSKEKGDSSPCEAAQVPVQSEETDAAQRIMALEAETADLKDKLLRKQADFENFRKRMFRERDEAARYANAALLSDVIGVIDDFERAIRSAEESRDFTVFLTGVSMIERQLVELLETRWGLKRFNSVGESFDPNKHEAVQRVEGPAGAKPTVVEDFQKGYFFHERVLRPAKVKVMVPSGGQPGGPAAGSETAGQGGPSGGQEKKQAAPGQADDRGAP